MPHNLQIRNGRVEDADRLAVLAAQVWLHTYATDGVNNLVARYILSEINPGKYLQFLNDPALHFLLAERSDSLVGFAAVDLGAPCPTGAASSSELRTLYVQAHHMGRGVGKALLEAAEAMARERSKCALWLKVNAKNERAIAFYARQGYSKVGTTYFVLGEGRHENHVLLGRHASPVGRVDMLPPASRLQTATEAERQRSPQGS